MRAYARTRTPQAERTALEQEVADALRAAGHHPWRGGMVRGRSGYAIESVSEVYVKVRWANGGYDMANSLYAREEMLPRYRDALRAAGFTAGVTCTQLKGEYVDVGPRATGSAESEKWCLANGRHLPDGTGRCSYCGRAV